MLDADARTACYAGASWTGLMGMKRVLADYVSFLRAEKKYWMIPLFIFVVTGLLMVFAQSTAVAPFIYTLF
jgi:hypothetical protein